MENETIIAVKDLAKEYVKQGYSYIDAVKKAEVEVRKKEDAQYGIFN